MRGPLEKTRKRGATCGADPLTGQRGLGSGSIGNSPFLRYGMGGKGGSIIDGTSKVPKETIAQLLKLTYLLDDPSLLSDKVDSGMIELGDKKADIKIVVSAIRSLGKLATPEDKDVLARLGLIAHGVNYPSEMIKAAKNAMNEIDRRDKWHWANIAMGIENAKVPGSRKGGGSFFCTPLHVGGTVGNVGHENGEEGSSTVDSKMTEVTKTLIQLLKSIGFVDGPDSLSHVMDKDDREVKVKEAVSILKSIGKRASSEDEGVLPVLKMIVGNEKYPADVRDAAIGAAWEIAKKIVVTVPSEI
jgi:hypothetical protein